MISRLWESGLDGVARFNRATDDLLPFLAISAAVTDATWWLLGPSNAWAVAGGLLGGRLLRYVVAWFWEHW